VIPTLLAQTASDSGSPGYVVAAVIVSAVLVLAYLVIVAFRVRDSAERLDALEERLDRRSAERDGGGPADAAGGGTGPGGAPGTVRDAEAVAAAAEALGGRR
jgi:hypothetical protein